MRTVGGKGGFHCPGMFIPPFPSFRVGLCTAMPQKQPLPPLGGSVQEIFIHTYIDMYKHALSSKKEARLIAPLKAKQVGRSGASVTGRLCMCLACWDVFSLGRLEPAMLPTEHNTVMILSSAGFIGQCVGCGDMFNQHSCKGGLDLMSVVPSLDCVFSVCVCVCVYVNGSQPSLWCV